MRTPTPLRLNFARNVVRHDVVTSDRIVDGVEHVTRLVILDDGQVVIDSRSVTETTDLNTEWGNGLLLAAEVTGLDLRFILTALTTARTVEGAVAHRWPNEILRRADTPVADGPTHLQIAAVVRTLWAWGDELEPTDDKFWSMAWHQLVDEVVSAMTTGAMPTRLIPDES